MDGEEAVVESGGCDTGELPNGERLLQATTSGKDSNQEERKDPPADEGVIARVANDKTSAQVGSEGSPKQGECDRPSYPPNEDPGGYPASEEVSSNKRSQRLDFLQTQQQVVLKGQQSHQQQLSSEWSGKQYQDEYDGMGRKEMVEKSEQREQAIELQGQEEFRSLQSLQLTSQSQTFSTKEFLDPLEKGSSLSQQRLNPPDRSLKFNNESAEGGQSSLQNHGHLEQESSHTAGDTIINQVPGNGEDQDKNNTKELKNADNSQNLQQGKLSSDNEVRNFNTLLWVEPPILNDTTTVVRINFYSLRTFLSSSW